MNFMIYNEEVKRMTKFARNLIRALSPWYDEKEADERDKRSASIVNRADVIIFESHRLLSSYRAANKAISDYQRKTPV
jgi:hypothetical protein